MGLGATQNQDRIAASIVSGIGFLGAGVILKMDSPFPGLQQLPLSGLLQLWVWPLVRDNISWH